jgi:protein TonB
MQWRQDAALAAAWVLAMLLHGLLWFGLRGEAPRAVDVAGSRAAAARVTVIHAAAAVGMTPAQRPIESAARSPDSVPTTESTKVEAQSAPTLSSAGDGDEFLDAKRLSVRPSPSTAISLPEPGGGETQGRAVMTLFIDEHGRVLRTRVESSTLAADYEGAARQVFAQAPFHPGMIDGRAVKSRLRVEVVVEEVAGAVAPAPSSLRPASSPVGN